MGWLPSTSFVWQGCRRLQPPSCQVEPRDLCQRTFQARCGAPPSPPWSPPPPPPATCKGGHTDANSQAVIRFTQRVPTSRLTSEPTLGRSPTAAPGLSAIGDLPGQTSSQGISESTQAASRSDVTSVIALLPGVTILVFT